MIYAKQKTLVVVTHRRPILALTERLILIEGNVVMDGPKDEILKSLVNLAPSPTLFNILIATFVSALLWSIWFQVDKSTNVTGVVEPKGNVIVSRTDLTAKLKK